MKKINKEDAGWISAQVWLQSLEQTARYIHGVKPQLICYRSYEHATYNWIKALQDEYQITPKRAKSIKEAIENYIEFGVIGGLFNDSAQFTIREITSNKVNIKVNKCLYLQVCKNLLTEGYTVQDITCPRLGCFNAAVKFLANIDTNYKIKVFNDEDGCEGIIERC